jgi:hypothetical protein
VHEKNFQRKTQTHKHSKNEADTKPTFYNGEQAELAVFKKIDNYIKEKTSKENNLSNNENSS